MFCVSSCSAHLCWIFQGNPDMKRLSSPAQLFSFPQLSRYFGGQSLSAGLNCIYYMEVVCPDLAGTSGCTAEMSLQVWFGTW